MHRFCTKKVDTFLFFCFLRDKTYLKKLSFVCNINAQSNTWSITILSDQFSTVLNITLPINIHESLLHFSSEAIFVHIHFCHWLCVSVLLKMRVELVKSYSLTLILVCPFKMYLLHSIKPVHASKSSPCEQDRSRDVRFRLIFRMLHGYLT